MSGRMDWFNLHKSLHKFLYQCWCQAEATVTISRYVNVKLCSATGVNGIRRGGGAWNGVGPRHSRLSHFHPITASGLDGMKWKSQRGGWAMSTYRTLFHLASRSPPLFRPHSPHPERLCQTPLQTRRANQSRGSPLRVRQTPSQHLMSLWSFKNFQAIPKSCI